MKWKWRIVKNPARRRNVFRKWSTVRGGGGGRCHFFGRGGMVACAFFQLEVNAWSIVPRRSVSTRYCACRNYWSYKLNFALEQAMKRNTSALSWTSAQDEGGWLTTRPGRFTPRKRPGSYFIWGCVGPRAGLDVCGKSRPNRDLIPGPSSPYWSYTAVILTLLCRYALVCFVLACVVFGEILTKDCGATPW